MQQKNWIVNLKKSLRKYSKMLMKLKIGALINSGNQFWKSNILYIYNRSSKRTSKKQRKLRMR